MNKLVIYGAACLKHYVFWQKLRVQCRDQNLPYEFNSHWPAWAAKSLSDELAALFWPIDLTCIHHADVVMLYAEPEDVLRGALVEAGAALAYGKFVLCVGDNYGFGSWTKLPPVLVVKDMSLAMQALHLIQLKRTLQAKPSGLDFTP